VGNLGVFFLLAYIYLVNIQFFMDNLIFKYSVGTVENIIIIPHITQLSYDDDSNTVSITTTNGSVIDITTTSGDLYETLIKKITTYYRAQQQYN
jgi:YD repeat-containing protein